VAGTFHGIAGTGRGFSPPKDAELAKLEKRGANAKH